ncbi:MFS transporter [Pseudonocardia cypriaca]|uniref:Putative MFS family arabinose efflux permease n=1 Tax=Pseudonocardia cypriaca TaxID=882449 RepID=A0A543GHQ3_9PSEU|nr:putative MFS family arabinose efflux permease [Pseudonocardia cypriaca]
MLPELGASYGVSAGTASLSVTAYFLPFAAVMFFSGALGERWGRRRTVVLGYAGYVVASLACVLAPTFPLFLAARALQGVANAFTTPLLLSALGAAAPRNRLGRALGWFGSLQAAGQTSAPLLGGVAAEADWRFAFGGVAVVAAALALVGIPPDEDSDGMRREPLATALRAALRPEVLRIGAAAALGWGCLTGLSFMVALRLEEGFEVGAGTRGLVLTAAGVAGLFTARLVGGSVDRIGRRRSVLIGAACGAIVIVGVGTLPTLWMIALAWAVGGVATQLLLVGVNALVLGSEHNRGGAVSVVQSLRFGGGALSPVAFTPLYHAAPLAGFLVPAALLALAVPAVLPREREG